MINIIRNSYFRVLDIAVEYTGFSKRQLHEYWMNKCFPFLEEDPTNFVDDKEISHTTTILTERGWNTFYGEFRHFCLDILKINV